MGFNMLLKWYNLRWGYIPTFGHLQVTSGLWQSPPGLGIICSPCTKQPRQAEAQGTSLSRDFATVGVEMEVFPFRHGGTPFIIHIGLGFSMK